MWGAAVNQTGIKDFEKAQLLWEEINHRKLTEPELKALKKVLKQNYNNKDYTLLVRLSHLYSQT